MNTNDNGGIKSDSSLDVSVEDATLETAFQETLAVVCKDMKKVSEDQEGLYRVIFFSGARAVMDVAPISKLASIQQEIEEELGPLDEAEPEL